MIHEATRNDTKRLELSPCGFMLFRGSLMLKIVRYPLLLSVLLNGILICAAQTKPHSRRPKPSTPTNAETVQKWTEYSSKEGGFRILFPGTPQQTSLTIELSTQQSQLYVVSYQSSIVYSAMYIDYPEALDDPVKIKDFLDNIQIGEIKSAISLGMSPRILSDQDTSLDGHPGRFLQVELSQDKIYRRKLLLVKNRAYIIAAAASKDDEKTPKGKGMYERLSMKFIDSFILIARVGAWEKST